MNNIAITVDVETDWGGRLKPTKENMRGIFHGLKIILDLFEKFEISATFFISSETIKEAKSELIKIKEYGHEIASHGHNHIKLDVLPKEKFKNQIEQSIDLLQETFDKEIMGFRSPQFRLNDAHFEILSELNIKYDSSVVPSLFPGRYSNVSTIKKPHIIGSVLEIPVSTFSIFKLPLGLMWLNLYSRNINKLFTFQCKPVILYFHLFDILSKKCGGDQFSWIVNRWYRINQKDVINTLTDFIETNIKNNVRFVRMIDIYRSHKELY